MKKPAVGFLLAAVVACVVAGNVHAEDLYRPGIWSALAADRRASAVGDILTILVYENARAANSAASGSKKSSRLDGRISAGSSFNEGGGLSLSGSSDNSGTSSRSGQMVAQISVTVDEVLPNGDLRVQGAQQLNLGNERSLIRIRGRVRSADITAANSILSSRLADAQIDYNGKGYVSRSGKPGIVTRIFSWLGVM